MAEELTPMLRQYRAMKRELDGDALLLFRLGDFYELFMDDAREAASLLGLALTQYRDDNRDRLPGWISNLHPQYMTDKKIYRCPRDTAQDESKPEAWKSWIGTDFEQAYDRVGNVGKYGTLPNADVVGVSYFYEFNESPCYWKSDGSRSWNEVKENDIRTGSNPYFPEIKYSGVLSTFPVVRCSFHLNKPTDNSPILNISYSGNTFYSFLEWETGTWTP